MQSIEQISNERPDKALRVIPIDPSLRLRYRIIVFILITLVLFSFNITLAFNEMIFNYSLFNFWVLYGVIIYLLIVFPLKPWRWMDQKRQQAARYCLTTGLLARANTQREIEAPDLPEYFALTVQRRRVLTWSVSLLLSSILFTGVFIAYTYGQTMLHNVQYGLAMATVIWEISLNSAVVLLWGYFSFSFLIINPRQSIIATRTGLLCWRGYQTSFIPWQQARLFAVIGHAPVKRQEPMLFYELSSADQVIRWPSAYVFIKQGLGSKVPSAVTLLRNVLTRPVGSTADFAQQIQLLNIIIAERTGLPLYDLR